MLSLLVREHNKCSFSPHVSSSSLYMCLILQCASECQQPLVSDMKCVIASINIINAACCTAVLITTLAGFDTKLSVIGISSDF